MNPRVINLLQPAGELAVEFRQRANALAGQAQPGFKILLQGAEHPLDFAAAPGPADFGVNQANAQIGADDPQVVIDERAAVVSVELARQAAAAQRFLETDQQRLGIGRQPVGGRGDEARVIVDDQAQVRRHRLGVQRQKRPRRKVHHPQVVDPGGFEDLGGTGNVLAQQITAPVSVQIVLLQPAINGREGRQRGIGLLPLAVEQFNGHAGKGAHLFQRSRKRPMALKKFDHGLNQAHVPQGDGLLN